MARRKSAGDARPRKPTKAELAAENARLFTELQAKDRELTTALDQQTATSEILRVISSSPTDLEPVARAIADSAGRLCECTYSAVFRFDGELIHWVAARGTSGGQEEALRGVWPRPPGRDTLVGRTILARETLPIHDVASDPSYTVRPAGEPAHADTARAALAIRSVLNVPMLRAGQPIGVIGLIRSEVRPFSEREIVLVQTFADQAVIAIENVRLFRELETRNADLTESLEQQTATSEILRVISSSATRAIPVIALTAHAMAGDREQALAAGCDGFDIKPIDLDRLLGKIEALLGGKART